MRSVMDLIGYGLAIFPEISSCTIDGGNLSLFLVTGITIDVS